MARRVLYRALLIQQWECMGGRGRVAPSNLAGQGMARGHDSSDLGCRAPSDCGKIIMARVCV